MIVGVLPREFRYPEFSEIWSPFGFWFDFSGESGHRRAPGSMLNDHVVSAIGRLKSGTAIGEARADLELIAGRLEEKYPDTNSAIGASVIGLRAWIYGEQRGPILIIYGVVCFVLLLACANVANLMLARSSERRHEIAVRMSLGAGRLRIVRQLLTESLLLASVGGTAGLLLGVWCRDLILAGIPIEFPPYFTFNLNWGVVLLSTGVVFICWIFFSLAPAVDSVRRNLEVALRSASLRISGDIKGNRLRAFLVAFEVALALTVLIGTSLMMRSFIHYQSVDLGFRPKNLATMFVTLPGMQTESFHQKLLQKVRNLPEVANASTVSELPTGSAGDRVSIYTQDAGPAPIGQAPLVTHHIVSARYFSTMEIPIHHGRDFAEIDALENLPRVAIVNEAFARHFWPDENSLGKRIAYEKGVLSSEPDWLQSREDWIQIVGVVGNTQNAGRGMPISPALYRPHSQIPLNDFFFVVRTHQDPSEMGEVLRQAAWSVDPIVPLSRFRSMEESIHELNWQPGFYLWTFGIFSVISLLLATVGVYGVVAYLVARRFREFGIRIVLGATPEQTLRQVVSQGLKMVGLGLLAGLGASLLLSRFLSAMLFGVSPMDLQIYALSTAIMGLIVFLAVYFPARRLTKMDLQAIVRYE
jgi:putative ABC transport system permease protein